MTQRQINAAHRRSLKPTYKGLETAESRLVKKIEQVEQLEKSIAETYRLGKQRYGPGFRKDSRFQEDFTLIFQWEEAKLKLLASVSRLEDRYQLDRDVVMKKFRLLNQGRGYGGSF
jgi:hypothetical protein